MEYSRRRDWEAELIRQHLPDGYFAHRHWGRWDLIKLDPPSIDGLQTETIIRSGIKTRWEVYRLARRHSRGLPMPYVYSAGYWRDIERGKSEWWMRLVDFVRYPHF